MAKAAAVAEATGAGPEEADAGMTVTASEETAPEAREAEARVVAWAGWEEAGWEAGWEDLVAEKAALEAEVAKEMTAAG